MYRLLIVDDEIAIVMGLEKVLSEIEDYELDIYKALGATEALQIAKSKQIDILLTDICMPGMDGLDLAKEIVSFNPRCKVIYLTGFSNFEYIYKAMELLGSQYILKSETDLKIKKAIKKAVDMIETERQEQLINAKIKLEQKKNYSLLKKGILENILKGDWLKEDVQSQCSRYELNISCNKKSYLLVGVLGMQSIKQTNYLEQIEMLYQVKVLLDERFEEEFLVESLLWEDKQLVWIIQDRDDRYIDNKRKSFRMIAEEYQNIITQLTQRVFNIGFIDYPLEFEEITNEYKRIQGYMSKQVDVQIPMIYVLEDSEQDDQLSEQIFIIEKLEQYISEHIGGDISLTQLADVIHFNPSYLSRFYKKNRGINLSEYIYELKLSKSKQLLGETDKKVGDIAIELGFDTASAFCAFFKKRIGCSPAQYRMKQ
nr:response regulator [uncultured Niameybacter sp.]